MISHLRAKVDHQLSNSAVRFRLFVHASSMFMHAVTPLENSTSLQLVLFADAKDTNPQNIPIKPILSKSFFMIV
jgi:hypothetical protein